MKTLLGKLAIVAIALGFALPVVARAQTGDNDAFTIQGQIFPPGKPIVSRDGVAMTRFDGRGGITQVDFVMQYPDPAGNASPVPGTPDPNTGFNAGEEGKYTVFEDCTGEMEIDFAPQSASGPVIKLRFVLSDEGRAIHTEVYSAMPDGVHPVPALIHSEGRKLGLDRYPLW
jgi:hypothetical protein